MTERVFNFNPGPAALPLPALEKARDEFLNFENSGMSVMELSHRGKEFLRILERAEKGLRRNLGIPDEYAVLFLGGGASLQFSMIPMNLAIKGKPVQLIHTGEWTKKAWAELKKGFDHQVVASGEESKFTKLPSLANVKFDPNASYVYMCSNNTIFGSQWKSFPDTGTVPLVCDMSSDIMSRAVDVKKFGLIYAGAQKNLGPAGVTVVIIRKDLVEKADPNLPTMLQYRTHVKDNSLYNTPPCFAIYMVALVAEWVEQQGGLKAVEALNEKKAKLLYDAIDSSSIYRCPVAKEDRSLMNIVFRIKNGDEVLEEKFVSEAKAQQLIGLKGHRSVGGLRASIYNAHPLEGVERLVSFMKEFESRTR